jgi:hypothetical protein
MRIEYSGITQTREEIMTGFSILYSKEHNLQETVCISFHRSGAIHSVRSLKRSYPKSMHVLIFRISDDGHNPNHINPKTSVNY